MMPKPIKFKWTVEVEIDERWVADGFDLENGESMEEMIKRSRLGYAYSHEVKCKVLTRPPDEAVAKAMGYKTVEEYVKQREK
jgi:hypothetical protein